jgi:hypothetical protein
LTFLNPIALFGLLAAGIPILLHIFNLRKLKTIEFSTLSFLKELQKTKIRRLKLRQLLLLLLRTLLVVLIVFTFSRPTLKGSLPGDLAEQAKTTAVILLDDSQSMTGSDEKGELLHQAKNAAIAVSKLLKDGDEVFFVKLSEVPVQGTPEVPCAQRDIRAIQNNINEIQSSSIHRSIEDALRFTARLLAASKNFNKEVYVISDFQSGSLESKMNISKTAEQLFAPTTQFFFIPLGKRKLQNVSVESIEIPNTIFEVNKPFIVKAQLANHGTSDVQNHVVSVYLDGSRVAQKGVDIRAGQSIEIGFTLVSKHSGFVEGTVELEDDDLEFDNKRYFTVHIPEELRALLVGSTSDLTYIRFALSARLSDSSANLKMTETTFDRFSSSQLNKTDVVMLSNPQELTINQTAALKTYLQNGGGAFIIPGNRTTANLFNTTFAVPLGISAITQSENQSSSAQPINTFIEFNKVDYQHPLFAGMFEETAVNKSTGTTHRQRILESPSIYTSLHFIPTPQSQSIITLTDGYPFLLEERIGNGHALLLSVAINPEWSNLPLKGLFVPLLHSSLAYLAQGPKTKHSLLVGEETTTRLRTSVPSKINLKKPDGKEVFVNTQQSASEKYIRFSGADMTGIYTMATGNLVLDKFAVNIDPDESDIIPSNENRRTNILNRLGIASNMIHTVSQPQDVQHIITESRLGAELWKQFLIAALIVAIIEMFVARERNSSLDTQQQKQNSMRDHI